jgi:RimJ/RimL family protein N-acetyltransferase
MIRNFSPGDWQELQELAIRYQASEYAQYDHPWPTDAEKVKDMAEWFASGDGYLAVCLKSTGRLIGLLNIHWRKELEGRTHGLGYVFHPDYHGRGYATESCRAGLEQVFGLWAADRVLCGTHPDNKPSIRLLKKLGLKETEQGEWTISREEWLAPDQKE